MSRKAVNAMDDLIESQEDDGAVYASVFRLSTHDLTSTVEEMFTVQLFTFTSTLTDTVESLVKIWSMDRL